MKKILLGIVRLPIFRILFSYYCRFQEREKKTSMGNENPDKVFYVIGQKERSGGLWWIVNKVIMHLAYADDNGWIPVVDYKSFWTQYHMEGELNKVNVWDKFFLQPGAYSLEDISRSRNIIISDKKPAPSEKYFMGNTDFYDNPERLEYFQGVFKKYIKFNSSTEKYLSNKRNTIIPNSARVLGVLCRGTDYLLKKPKNHPIQPDPQDVIELASRIMSEYSCDYIFLATEDEDILNLFKAKFGDGLLFVDQKRISKSDMHKAELVVDVNKESNQDKYLMGLDYLLATYILSTCNCFIGGRTGGTKGVLLMQDKFEYKYIYNLGFYD